MDKESKMARKEKKRQSMLLDSSSNGEYNTASSRGDSWEKEASASRGCYGGEIKDTKAKSKSCGKAKRANACTSKSAGHKRDNKDRKQNRGNEREDKHPRRSASDLGITFPGSYCSGSTPHYWVEMDNLDRGSLFQCNLCYRYLWLPNVFYLSTILGNLMKKKGADDGYCTFLNSHVKAKVLMAKMQDLRRLEEETEDKVEFARLAAKILGDKEYDLMEAANGKRI